MVNRLFVHSRGFLLSGECFDCSTSKLIMLLLHIDCQMAQAQNISDNKLLTININNTPRTRVVLYT